MRIAVSLASAPALVKKALFRPGGVIRASSRPSRPRAAVACCGTMNGSSASCSPMACATRGSAWPMLTFMACELKSR